MRVSGGRCRRSAERRPHRCGSRFPWVEHILFWAVGTGLAAFPIVLANSLAAQELPLVQVAQADEAGIVEEVRLTGSLTSLRSARLSPEVAGRVERIAVDAGDRVEAGALLLELDDALARIELEQARAAEREAETAFEDARRRLGEAQRLAEHDSLAETQLRSREAEVREDAAVLDRRRAERALREALLERHSLEAPFPGVVSRRMTDLGEWVEPGTPVLELVGTGSLRLDLQVPQTYFGRAERDTPVRVQFDAFPEQRFDARIAEVVPVSDSNARTFLARVPLDNANGRLAPGMSARATLEIQTGRRGVIVIRDALLRYPDGRVVVWVAHGEGRERTVSERQVRTGLSFGDRVAISRGLEAGTAVVVRGNEALQDGQAVRVQNGR